MARRFHSEGLGGLLGNTREETAIRKRFRVQVYGCSVHHLKTERNNCNPNKTRTCPDRARTFITTAAELESNLYGKVASKSFLLNDGHKVSDFAVCYKMRRGRSQHVARYDQTKTELFGFHAKTLCGGKPGRPATPNTRSTENKVVTDSCSGGEGHKSWSELMERWEGNAGGRTEPCKRLKSEARGPPSSRKTTSNVQVEQKESDQTISGC